MMEPGVWTFIGIRSCDQCGGRGKVEGDTGPRQCDACGGKRVETRPFTLAELKAHLARTGETKNS
jgi:hypothetical protein